MIAMETPSTERVELTLPSPGLMDEWRNWFYHNIGARYANCTLDNYKVASDEQAKAVEKCRAYFENFSVYARQGRGLIFIGPPGTGKDHLMIGTAKLVMERFKRCKVRYKDGLTIVSELRSAKFNEDRAAELADLYAAPSLLCLSDPIPPSGTLDDFDTRSMFRIIDRRYREQVPTWATLNVASRQELNERMGAQAADRLCDGAVTVVCNWESFRTVKKPS